MRWRIALMLTGDEINQPNQLILRAEPDFHFQHMQLIFNKI